MSFSIKRFCRLVVVSGGLLLGSMVGCGGTGGGEAVAPETVAPRPPDDGAGDAGKGSSNPSMEQAESDG